MTAFAIVPAPREALEATPRKAMTPARRRRVLLRHGGVCAYPGCEVRDGLEIDHSIPLELGGADEDHNLEPLCGEHHKRKTRLDAKLIAKARRLRRRDDGTRRPRKPIPSPANPWRKGKTQWPKRGFQKRKPANDE